MKRFLSILLLFAMMLTMLTSCKDDSNDQNQQNDDSSSSGTSENPETPNDNTNNDNNDNNDPTEEGLGYSELFYNYSSSIVEIGDFYNGLACFKIKETNNDDREKLGYVNIEGDIVIQPIYRYPSGHVYNLEIVDFKDTNCVLLYDSNGNGKLVDNIGKVLYTVGENGVTKISSPSNGYFCITTAVEEFTGYVYTVTYYSAMDFKEIDGPILNDNSSDWTVDVEKIESFQGLSVKYHVSSSNNTLGKIATVELTNKDKITYYTTVDQNGNVLMAPQKNIRFEKLSDRWQNINDFDFCNDLCPAYDQESGYWGYIDPYGTWKIQPQYSIARSFTADGYAFVNNKVVIDTEGKAVLGPIGWTLKPIDIVSKLFTRPDNVTNHIYTVTFQENGEFVIEIENDYGYYLSYTNTYLINGSTLQIESYDLSTYFGGPTLFYQLYYEGENLYIGGTKWKQK